MERTPENLLMVLKFNLNSFNQKNLNELLEVWPVENKKKKSMSIQEFYNVISTLKTLRKDTLEEFETKILNNLE